MSNVREILETFEALQKRRSALETERGVIEKDLTDLKDKLKAVHPDLTLDNLDINVQALEKKLEEEIARIDIPGEYRNELSKFTK